MTTPHRTLVADGQDLAFVMVEIVDREGRVVTDADNLVSFSIKGQGEIQAVGSADIKDTTPFTSHSWKAFHGKLMVVLRSGHKGGTMTLKATAKGLRPMSLNVRSRRK